MKISLVNFKIKTEKFIRDIENYKPRFKKSEDARGFALKLLKKFDQKRGGYCGKCIKNKKRLGGEKEKR